MQVDLAGIVIHKWVPMHGINLILRLCPAGLPSQAELRNFAVGPK